MKNEKVTHSFVSTFLTVNWEKHTKMQIASNDILSVIFEYLHFTDQVLLVAPCCKAFLNIIFSQEISSVHVTGSIVYKSFAFVGQDSGFSSVLLKIMRLWNLVNFHQHSSTVANNNSTPLWYSVKSLSLNCMSSTKSQEGCDPVILLRFIKLFPNVKEISLRGLAIENWDLGQVLLSCQQLQMVKIQQCRISRFSNFTMELPNIKHIDMQVNYMDLYNFKFPNVQTAKFSRFSSYELYPTEDPVKSDYRLDSLISKYSFTRF